MYVTCLKQGLVLSRCSPDAGSYCQASDLMRDSGEVLCEGLLCGLELRTLETSVPSLPSTPCSQVDAIREANAPGALGGEAEGLDSRGLGWETALFQTL